MSEQAANKFFGVLDMDGVFFDFITMANRATGIPLHHSQVVDFHYYRPYMDWETYRHRILLEGQSFWSRLDRYAWGADLMEVCESAFDEMCWLTDPGTWPDAMNGKMDCLIDHGYDDIPMICAGAGGPKAVIARIPNAVLIDDRIENCEAFHAAGGSAILFPQPWNKNRWAIRKMGRVQFVQNELYLLMNQKG